MAYGHAGPSEMGGPVLSRRRLIREGDAEASAGAFPAGLPVRGGQAQRGQRLAQNFRRGGEEGGGGRRPLPGGR